MAALAMGHGLPWRWDRFVNRIAVMVGPASQPYQMFAPTVEGHLSLLAATARSLVWAAGIPLTIALVVGMVTMIRSGRTLVLGGLLLPAVTYYAGFLSAILYVYDRFLVGWLPILAAIGGIGLASLAPVKPGGRAVGAAVAVALVGVGAVNAVAMNVVFARDPRHAAWQWLRRNVPCGSSVGVTFNGRYVPPLDCLDMWELTPGAIDGMARWPQYLVLNDAYLQRFRDSPSGAAFYDALLSGAAGYTSLWRAQSSPPRWAPLYWEERFWNGREDIETTADKPLHGIGIWECVKRAGCDRPVVE
jgi:hypothetical protein